MSKKLVPTYLFLAAWGLATAGNLVAQTPPASPLPGEQPAKPELSPAPRMLPAPAAGTASKPSPEQESLREALERLRQERQSLTAERQQVAKTVEALTRPNETERMRLRLKIADLLGKLAEKSLKTPAGSGAPAVPPTRPMEVEGAQGTPRVPAPTEKEPITPVSPLVTQPSADRLTLAQTQYRAGEADAALTTLKDIDTGRLPRADRAWAQYLIGSCLRKQGKLNEAAAAYREVAELNEEAYLTESALWHLSLIRWRQDVQGQLSDLQQRRETR